MSQRNLLLLLGLLLAAAIITTRNIGEISPERTSLTLPPIAQLDTLEIKRFGLDAITLKKTQNAWFLEPGHRPISDRMSKLLNSAFAQPIESDYEIALEGLKPQDFSVTHAATVISMKKADQTVLAFRMGKLVEGKHTFIRPLGVDRVYRIEANLRELFDRQPIDWRERRVIGREVKDIKSIKSTGKGFEDWALSRRSSDSDWEMDIPRNILVSQAVANAMANTVATVRAEAFHEGATFEAQLKIELETFEGQTIGLELGPIAESKGRLARTQDGLVFMVPRHQAMFMTPTIGTLRNRRLFKFNPDEAVELIFSGPPRIHLRRQPDKTWSMVAPQERRKLSPMVMDSALSLISGLETVGFPPSTATDPMKRVYAELTIKLIDEREVTVTLGRQFNGTDARYAESTSRPGELYVLPLNSIKAVQPTVDDLTIGSN